ncbi:MAG: preprotein translocase subunit YajC [Candidatus Auribacterota bacterium]|jgi:preprotein translocase subunit YajC|nr:preprotein translocase subunit YajC [Candidatus Auribacterota bacterium]
MNFSIFAQATPPAPQGISIFSMLPMFFMIILIFYFLVYRPQQKEQKKTQEMLSKLKNGDHVITTGGIHGIVAGVKDTTVLLKVCGDVKIEVSKSHISAKDLKNGSETKAEANKSYALSKK